ncbi:hypothetical protein HZH66_005236 [Vespula vulgaris]|uniref:Uncharacterized protein n=1 Tax=Vespula vulgaris TaxID=7454 RepID=A0A834K9J3_VESVU|nr:hypothetical protein HZH66_005236 [Vespula vulgaris]
MVTPICSGRRRTRSRPQNGRLIKAVRFGIPVDTEFRWYLYLFQSSYIFFFSSSFSLVSPIERIPIQIELFTKGAYTLTIDNTNTLMILINSRISFSSYLEKLYRIYGNVDYMTPLSLMNLLR